MTSKTAFILVDERSDDHQLTQKTVNIPVKIQGDYQTFAVDMSLMKHPHLVKNTVLKSAASGSRAFSKPLIHHNKNEKLEINSFDNYNTGAANQRINEQRKQNEEKSEEKNEEQKLRATILAICRFQSSNGAWNLDGVLNTLKIKLNESDAKKWKGKEQLIAGLLAIRYLNENSLQLSQFVIEKGKKYIDLTFSKAEIDEGNKFIQHLYDEYFVDNQKRVLNFENL